MVLYHAHILILAKHTINNYGADSQFFATWRLSDIQKLHKLLNQTTIKLHPLTSLLSNLPKISKLLFGYSFPKS